MAGFVSPVSASAVSGEASGRIRRAMRRLTDPCDIVEIRRAAEREAGIAESAGDQERVGFCRAIVEEATAVAEASRCISGEQIQDTAHARPFRF